jgi:hypothetical protein
MDVAADNLSDFQLRDSSPAKFSYQQVFEQFRSLICLFLPFLPRHNAFPARLFRVSSPRDPTFLASPRFSQGHERDPDCIARGTE